MISLVKLEMGRRSCPDVICKKDVFRNFAEMTWNRAGAELGWLGIFYLNIHFSLPPKRN